MLHLEELSPYVFAGVSAIAATLNAVFLTGAVRRNRALLDPEAVAAIGEDAKDPVLLRISRGFIFTWSFIVVADLIRVIAGVGVLLGHPSALLVLLLTPFGSVWVAIVGLRSFR